LSLSLATRFFAAGVVVARLVEVLDAECVIETVLPDGPCVVDCGVRAEEVHAARTIATANTGPSTPSARLVFTGLVSHVSAVKTPMKGPLCCAVVASPTH
jgi:hypothetical protein